MHRQPRRSQTSPRTSQTRSVMCLQHRLAGLLMRVPRVQIRAHVPLALQQDDFVMLETPGEDGSMSQIIYRNGGEVRASSVEMLCDKVGRAESCIALRAIAAVHVQPWAHQRCHLTWERYAREQVGWPRRPVAKMEAALSNSYMVSTLTLRTQRGSAEAEELLIGAQSLRATCHCGAPRWIAPYNICSSTPVLVF